MVYRKPNGGDWWEYTFLFVAHLHPFAASRIHSQDSRDRGIRIPSH